MTRSPRENSITEELLSMNTQMVAIVLSIMLSRCGFADSAARTVKYRANDIVAIKAKMKYTTLIELPPAEKILEVATGDKDFWIIDAAQNFCFLHPAKSGIHSNLNLITDKGNVYSFTLDEVSGEPDLKVIIEPTDASALTAASASPRLVSAQEADLLRVQAQTARTQAEEAVNRFRSEYPTKDLRFDYRYRDDPPFALAALYHDDRFTYIKSNASEKFAVYEVKDGKPSVVEFQLLDGTYVLPKVIDHGYLEIGKKRLTFERVAKGR
jgi:type IV secretion system protein VirB9